jgi:membrane protein implicated in regulation of membrane protease activity
MFVIYLACAGLGLTLIVVSLLFGGDHDTAMLDLDADADLDVDSPPGALTDLEHAAEIGPWLPFASMRFWTFSFASFGLIGASLSALALPWWVALAAAVIGGGTLGTGAAAMFRALARDKVSGDLQLHHLVGQEGTVTLVVRPGGRGKVLVQTSAGAMELTAITSDPQAIERGSRVLIASVEGSTLNITVLPDA